MRYDIFKSLYCFHLLQGQRYRVLTSEEEHTRTSMLLRLPVIAWFFSSSVGGSTRFAVFSSTDNRGSFPSFVTHGCSLLSVSNVFHAVLALYTHPQSVHFNPCGRVLLEQSRHQILEVVVNGRPRG